MSLRVEAGFEHLREALAETLTRVVEFPRGCIVTVLAAKVTANTAHARVTLSVMPETMQDEVIRSLKEYDAEIKEELATHVRLRRIPRLHYVFDDMEAHAAGIETELNALKKRGEL